MPLTRTPCSARQSNDRLSESSSKGMVNKIPTILNLLTQQQSAAAQYVNTMAVPHATVNLL
jgi:hypothetical protein